MTLQQLEYFLAAAEHRSFSAAAAELHMAQPSLSEQVRRLEAELGVRLFTRGGRRLELTEAGRLLRPRAERALAAVREAGESVQQVRALTGGTATFGMFGNAPSWLLTELVGEFRRRHPAVHIRIVGQNSSLVADAVREGRLEAGLVMLPIDDRGLDVRPSIRDELFYLSTDPESVRGPVSAEGLAGAPLILYDASFGWDDPTRRQLYERAQSAGVRLEPVVEVEDVEAALALVARGFGDTVAPLSIIPSSLEKRLQRAPFDPPIYDTFAFIHRRDAHLSPATRAFLEIAEKRLERLGERVPS
jgi:DNA-binding transcriptional LysR family regulator